MDRSRSRLQHYSDRRAPSLRTGAKGHSPSLRIILLLILLLPLSALAEPLRLGALLDLSKTYAPQGQAFLRGIELGVEELNKTSPGSVEYFVEDTQYDSKNAVTAAQRLITQKKVAALFTMTAIEQKSVVLMAKNVKVLTVSLWDSSPEIESFGEYSFGFGPWTPATGEKSADFSFSKLGAKSAYIVTEQDEWGELTANYFKESFEKLGGKVLGFDKLEPDATDFRSTVTKIRNSNADLVFFPVPRNASQFIKQARAQKLTQQFVTADIFSEEEIKNSQGAAEGIYHLEGNASESEKAKLLYQKYRERYGSECELKPFLSWGYDAVLILEDGWKRAKQQSGKAFADAVRATKELELSTGKISITEKGSAPKYPSAHLVKNGKMQAVQ